jgi:small subunit ribosomal protein S17e
MGRIKTKKVKAISNELFAEHKQEFKTEYDGNKEVVDKLIRIPSKKLKNQIVGYVTRMAKEKR